MPTPPLRQLAGAVDQFLPANRRGRDKQFFTYGMEFLPLTASATLTGNISIQADSDFLILEMVRVVTDTTDLIALAFCPELVTLIDSGSGRTLFDRAQHMDNIAGTGQLPAVWDYPYFLQRNSNFAVTVQNLEAVNRNVRIGFRGLKIF